VEEDGNAVYNSRFIFTYDFEKYIHDMSTTNRIGLSSLGFIHYYPVV